MGTNHAGSNGAHIHSTEAVAKILELSRSEGELSEEDKAQLEKERVEDMALAQQLIVVGEYLMSETRALKPLSPTATEFGEKYDCPLKLPGLRMLGTNPQEDEDFNCTHALVKSLGSPPRPAPW